MIKSFISRVFGRGAKQAAHPSKPSVYGPDKHNIRKDHISRGARKTCEELQRAGHTAFVVGGAVRDLILGMRPKDFDVATSAHPDEVRSLFRRSRIIGRRFQIVHVMWGAETVEVSTYRAHFTAKDPESDDERDTQDAHGRVLSDNVFGTQAEDALRRDFTVNALFYDPVKEEVWDFQHGVKDLVARKLVMIGDPATRYREDPVRMLRAARLSAKLGLAIDPKTAAPIPKLASLIQNVPPARLFDEMQKLLLSGHATETLASLRAHGLSHGLLPLLDVILEQPLGTKFIEKSVLRRFTAIDPGTEVSPQPRWGAPRTADFSYPFARDEDSRKKHQVALAWLTSDIRETGQVDGFRHGQATKRHQGDYVGGADALTHFLQLTIHARDGTDLAHKLNDFSSFFGYTLFNF